MYDASEGARLARKLYDEVVAGGEVTDWEEAIGDNAWVLDDAESDELLDLMSWTLDGEAQYELANVLLGARSMLSLLAAALEAEHEYGWGQE